MDIYEKTREIAANEGIKVLDPEDVPTHRRVRKIHLRKLRAMLEASYRAGRHAGYNEGWLDGKDDDRNC